MIEQSCIEELEHQMMGDSLPEEDFARSAYWPTDDEMAPVHAQFVRFCDWLGVRVALKCRIPLTNQDFIDDVSQEAMIELAKLIARYKRQFYVVGCYEWFERHPYLIPTDRFHQVQFAMFCWRFRGQLGPKHGFKPVHDQNLSAAMSHVIAPVDFRWEPMAECLRFLESIEPERLELLNDIEAKAFRMFLAACRDGKCRPWETFEVDGKETRVGEVLNIALAKLSSLPLKPCRSRPFFMDRAFHPYAKRILINWSNKFAARRPRGDGMGYLCIEEFGDLIPDTRISSSNPHMRRSDVRYQMRRADTDVHMPDSSFLFDAGNGDDMVESIEELLLES